VNRWRADLVYSKIYDKNHFLFITKNFTVQVADRQFFASNEAKPQSLEKILYDRREK
jgi:hypothetical protein